MTVLLALAAIVIAAEFIASPAPIPGLPSVTMGDVLVRMGER